MIMKTGNKIYIYAFLSVLPFLNSCVAFRNSTLFESEKSINTSVFEQTLMSMNASYVIQKTDILAISVFPNKGEQLIDPTGDFPLSESGKTSVKTSQGSGALGAITDSKFAISSNGESPGNYLVDMNGEINIPVLGYLKVEGFTLIQTDSMLAKAFSGYMKEPYVITQYLNKKVIVMGALGDKIVPLNNENTSLYEVLVQTASLTQGGQNLIQSNLKDARVDEIKIIRNYKTDNISVLKVDLSTVEGAMQLHTNIQPDDIIYIKPRRTFDGSTFSDIGRIISPIASVLALVLTIVALNR
ncbi:MAG: polysaccharide export outer membrane protein [Arenicella sp.]|jgi:polysaccharide export outer membrane protein